MPHARILLPAEAEFAAAFERLATRFCVPQAFPAEVEAAAEAAAARGLPDYADRTDIPFVSLDPAGSMDVDQLVWIDATAAGYTVYYAVADVATFVAPGGPLDQEARRRGATLYIPGQRVPLHPLVLSEGAASLLADGRVRPAAVWEITLDTDGAVTSAHVARGLVRNRAQLAYEAVQAQLDAGTADGVMVRLAEVGRLRQAQEAARGGVSLNVPEQVAERTEAGWRLGFRRPAPVELWNAQISLLTGTAAARLMLDGGVGLLRTLAAALPENLDRLHRVAHGLKIAWPDALGYPDFVRSLDPAKAKHLAMLNACRSLFRGAGYAPVDRARPGVTPPELVHAAVALPYAHVTAPLRRLVDRFGAECCLAISAGVAAPDWVRDALPALPALMAQSGAVAGQVEAAALNLLEALVLQDHVGETFGATVVATRGRDKATIQLHDPAVEASLAGRAKLGADIEVRLAAVDVAAPSVRFDVA